MDAADNIGRGERWVRSEEELASLRTQQFSVLAVYRELKASGRLLLSTDVGFGKTDLLRRMIEEHRRSPRYDLLVYLTSQHRVLREQPCVQEHEALPIERRSTHDVSVLIGRPAERCGPLDAKWKTYEKSGCSVAARTELCGRCPSRLVCSWPDQLSVASLAGKKVIMSLQTYLTTIPNFLARLKQATGAASMVVLIDEAAFLDDDYKRLVDYQDLRRSRAAFVRAVEQMGTTVAIQEWVNLHDRLLDLAADVTALQVPVSLSGSLTLDLQRAGIEKFGQNFRFLGFELASMLRSRRWRSDDLTGVSYISRPHLDIEGVDYLIAAAGLPVELARHRLGEPNLRELAPDIRILHAGSQVFNINSSLGAARNYPANEQQILYMAAQFILKLAEERKRTLTVTKKRFAESAAVMLEGYLRELSSQPYRVVVDASADDLRDPLVVPLITYGAVGVNTYENIDAAIALCSYNARQDVVQDRLNDVHGHDEHVEIERLAGGSGSCFTSVGYWKQQQGYADLARDYQHQYETAVVEQALGRIRFTIHPRIVVFFQRGALRYPLTAEFTDLAGVREYFGLASRRQHVHADAKRRAQVLREAGSSLPEVASALDVSVRTVRRYLKSDTKSVRDPLQGSCHSTGHVDDGDEGER